MPLHETSAKREANDQSTEIAKGGGDRSNDTPGIVEQGSTPSSPFDVVAPSAHSQRSNKLVWLAILVALGSILAYAAGILR